MHNHTIFCNHATGRIEDYIKKAIEKNIKHYGFSEHAPMDFDKSYRLKKSDVLQYETEIKNFQKKFHPLPVLRDCATLLSVFLLVYQGSSRPQRKKHHGSRPAPVQERRIPA